VILAETFGERKITGGMGRSRICNLSVVKFLGEAFQIGLLNTEIGRISRSPQAHELFFAFFSRAKRLTAL
jgi:hypothetical protein